MAWFLGIVATVALAVMGLWQPPMWIGAGPVVGLVILSAIEDSRAAKLADDLERLPSRR